MSGASTVTFGASTNMFGASITVGIPVVVVVVVVVKVFTKDESWTDKTDDAVRGDRKGDV